MLGPCGGWEGREQTWTPPAGPWGGQRPGGSPAKGVGSWMSVAARGWGGQAGFQGEHEPLRSRPLWGECMGAAGGGGLLSCRTCTGPEQAGPRAAHRGLGGEGLGVWVGAELGTVTDTAPMGENGPW